MARRNPLRGVPLPSPSSSQSEQIRFRLVDAKDQVVGRLAAQLARILQGKDKPTYAPNSALTSDVVIVKNAAKVAFTGRKWDDKLYRWHTGYPGGLRERTAAESAARDPTAPLRDAVYGMLPKNSLRAARARKLRLFAGEGIAPFSESDPRVVPWNPPERTLRVKAVGGKSSPGGGKLPPELPEGFAPLNASAFARRFRAHRGFAAPDPVAGDGDIPAVGGGGGAAPKR